MYLKANQVFKILWVSKLQRGYLFLSDLGFYTVFSANAWGWLVLFTQFAYKLFFTIVGLLSEYFRFSDIVSVSNMDLFQLWNRAFDSPRVYISSKILIKN